jgi:(1->4)-alpha-D-glucan 1-alpha-D-glucosylmutase
VLAHGREASTASWFDVDWDALDGRIGLPLLGDTLDNELAAGALQLREHDGRPVVGYHDHLFPVAEGTEGDDVAAVLDKQHYVLASWPPSSGLIRLWSTTS